MSYRLITRATLTITPATGEPITRVTEVRAYPSPKRDASGAITVDGKPESYKRTGGKGRGTQDRRYMYFPMRGESAYTEITEAEATALIGGSVTIVAVAAEQPAPAPASEQPAQQPAPEAPKAQRRVKA